MCKVKASSKVGIRHFDVLGPGDRAYRLSWLKLRQRYDMMICKMYGGMYGIVCERYDLSIGRTLGKGQG